MSVNKIYTHHQNAIQRVVTLIWFSTISKIFLIRSGNRT